MRIVVVMVVLVVSVGNATAAPSADRTSTRGANVVALAASGPFVAAALDKGKVECVHAELWNTSSNKVTHLGKKVACDAPSTIRGPALAGNRAVWATAVGGNQLDWTVWTATTSSPTPKTLATVMSADAMGADPILIGRAGAGLLPYAVGSEITALRANGSTAWTQTAPAPVVVLAAGNAPGYTGVTGAFGADGSATVIDSTGNIVVKGASTSATDECLLATGVIGAAPGLIVNTGTTPPTQFAVPKSAKLLGCVPDIVLYRVGSTIKGIRISTGKTGTLVTGTKIAAISAKGLAWATGPVLHWRPAASAFASLT
jgi:hypothetical protein